MVFIHIAAITILLKQQNPCFLNIPNEHPKFFSQNTIRTVFGLYKGKHIKRKTRKSLPVTSNKTLLRIGQSLKTVNWYVEIIKAILTGLVILLVSTAILGIAAYFSPGEYVDSRLEQYLLKMLSKEIGIDYSEDGIRASRALYGIQNGMVTKDVIILCGEYATDPSFIDIYLNGHYICIFERAPRSFFNDLFRTKSKYVPTFIRISDPNSGGNAPGGLSCLACEAVDVDSDGLMEIRLEYISEFADRSARMVAIIEQIGSQWGIITPDFSTVKDELCSIANKDVYASIDTFNFYNPHDPEGENEILYGLSNNGYIRKVDNPLTGGIDWLFCVAVFHYDKDLNRYRNYAYIMERLTGNGIVRETDWNVGSVYFPQHESRDIEEFVYSLWGWSPYMEYNTPWID